MKEIMEFIFQDGWHYFGTWFLAVSVMAVTAHAVSELKIGSHTHHHTHIHGRTEDKDEEAS